MIRDRFDLGIFGGTKIEEILEVEALQREEETQENLKTKEVKKEDDNGEGD